MAAEQTVRMLSRNMMNAPSMVAWAKTGYVIPEDRQNLRNVIKSWPGIDDEIANGLLTGTIPYTIEEKNVVFVLPVGWSLKEPEFI